MFLLFLACAHHDAASIPEPVGISEPPPTYDEPPPPAPRRADGSAVETRPLTVRFEGATQPAAVEVACESGWRLRRSVVSGGVVVPGVPVGDACRLNLKGIVATSVPVDGGHILTCTFVGTTTSCR